MTIDSPNTTGKTPEENIKLLQRWAIKIANTLNYGLNHLDRASFIESERPITRAELDQALAEQYEEIRKQFIAAINNIAPKE